MNKHLAKFLALLLIWLGSLSSVCAAEQAVYYIHTDQLNTPRIITDADQAPVWKWDSDAFGSTPATEQPGTVPAFVFNLRFAGQYFDRESNLHYNYFRDYDPLTGRYVQSDPIGLDGGINTYAYVGGDPINYFDPWGQSKVQGQASIGGSDSAVAGISKSSTKAEVDAAVKRAEAVLKDPKASPARKSYLKGWIKVAKRGFTKAICPPFLEDVTKAVVRQRCLEGDMEACRTFEYMGGEIVNPNEV